MSCVPQWEHTIASRGWLRTTWTWATNPVVDMDMDTDMIMVMDEDMCMPTDLRDREESTALVESPRRGAPHARCSHREDETRRVADGELVGELPRLKVLRVPCSLQSPRPNQHNQPSHQSIGHTSTINRAVNQSAIPAQAIELSINRPDQHNQPSHQFNRPDQHNQ